MTLPPTDLSPRERKLLRAWTKRTYPHLLRKGPGGLRDLVDECLDYYLARYGDKQRYSDWLAVVRNWVRKHERFEARRTQPAVRGSAEMPCDLTSERDGEGSTADLFVVDGGKR